MKDIEGNHILEEINRHSWPPQCWSWAWDTMNRNLGQKYNGQNIITFHEENKRICPYCIQPRVIKKITW